MKRMLTVLLAVAMALSMIGCQKTAYAAKDLMDGVFTVDANPETDPKDSARMVTDFSLRLFQASMTPEKDTLISPLSVLAALSMTANGAEGETLEQMESVLGQNAEALNDYFAAYLDLLEEDDSKSVSLANSIWFRDDPAFIINEGFLKTNSRYYDAGIYQAPFDETTLKDINQWVEHETKGMIENVLDNIPDNAMVYLVNALAFDAAWRQPYTSSQVVWDRFTMENGESKTAELMYSSESRYLEDENAVGFMKHYNGNYAFVALLPHEGISVGDYVAGLTVDHLHALLTEENYGTVCAAIPKFETQCSYEMGDILQTMGITDAFGWTKADFSGLGTHEELNICLTRCIHKTFISVTEQGTRAGAATVVEAAAGAAAMEPKEVILNRPFVYLLVDTKTNTPLFMGTMMGNGI